MVINKAKIQAGANATLVEREKLIYPLASLVSYFLKGANQDPSGR